MSVRLAVDFGTKRLGLAVSEAGFVRPLVTLERRGWGHDMEEIRKHLLDYGVEEVVVGIPAMLDGTDSAATLRARAFVTDLEAAIDVPVHTWDEALTSWEADQRMDEQQVPRRERGRWRDAYAAAVILEDYERGRPT